jgi:F-type H+-transporting ATPase subunit g
LNKFWNNAKIELAFPGPSEWGQVRKGFEKVAKSAQTGAFANLTVREAAKNALVVAEVGTFFYIGEIIGRRSIIGYDV